MKKLLVSLLCVMMVFCMMPSMAFAEDVPANDVYEFPADNGTLTFTKDGKLQTSDGSVITETKIRFSVGDTLKVVKADDTEEVVIGGTVDTDQFALTIGTVLLDLTEKTVTLEANSEMEIPAGKKAYLMLGSGGPALDTITKSGATCTVKGVLKAVTGSAGNGDGSHIIIEDDGKLVVEETGTLSISQFADVTVKSGGALELPLMTEEAMVGTEKPGQSGVIQEGTGMKGDIVIEGGATLKYANVNVLGDTSPMFKSEGNPGSAVLNLAGKDGHVQLTVNGDLQTAKEVKTLFVHKKDASDANDKGFRPMDITVESGKMTVAAGTTLDLVNGSELDIADVAALDIAGTMEIHSAAKFAKKADVSGKVYVFDDESTTPAKGAAFTLTGTGKVYAAAQDITATTPATTITAQAGYKVEKNENANASYTSISANPANPTTFKYAYGAKATSSGGIYVPPTTDPLPPAKTESNSAVQNYVKPADYEDAEAAEIKAIMDKAAEDIKNAKTVEEVKAIEAAAKAEIDKLDTAEEKAVIRTVETTKFRATSKRTTLNGKKAIKITWNKPEGVDFDGYDIYRSTKQFSGFGKTPFFTTTKQTYTNNKGLEVGKTYYYKVRAYKYVNGRKVYSEYSYKAIRTVK